MAKRNTPYNHRCWPTLRLMILRRDGYQCQVHGPRCTHVANECDHIEPWLDGGAWFNPANLRAACTACNKGRRNQPHKYDTTPSRTW